MSRNGNAKSRNGNRKRRTLRDVLKGQGRSFVWLARQTGYTPEHISGVASGYRTGSPAFHLSMKRVLGEDYAA